MSANNGKLKLDDRWIYKQITEEKCLLLRMACLPIEGSPQKRAVDLIHVVEYLIGNPRGYAISLLTRYVGNDEEAAKSITNSKFGGLSKRNREAKLPFRKVRFEMPRESRLTEMLAAVKACFREDPEQFDRLLEGWADSSEGQSHGFSDTPEGEGMRLAQELAAITAETYRSLPPGFLKIWEFIATDEELQERIRILWKAKFRSEDFRDFSSHVQQKSVEHAWNGSQDHMLRHGVDLRYEFSWRKLKTFGIRFIKNCKRQQAKEQAHARELIEQSLLNVDREAPPTRHALREEIAELAKREIDIVALLFLQAKRQVAQDQSGRLSRRKLLESVKNCLNGYADVFEEIAGELQADIEELQTDNADVSDLQEQFEYCMDAVKATRIESIRQVQQLLRKLLDDPNN